MHDDASHNFDILLTSHNLDILLTSHNLRFHYLSSTVVSRYRSWKVLFSVDTTTLQFTSNKYSTVIEISHLSISF